jgi:hypothetical protein
MPQIFLNIGFHPTFAVTRETQEGRNQIRQIDLAGVGIPPRPSIISASPPPMIVSARSWRSTIPIPAAASASVDRVGDPREGGKLVMVELYGGANPISTVLFPFKMMTIEGSYVGTLEDLRELLELVQAGKVPPIPIETRPVEQASAALSDSKSGVKVQGRVVLYHH